jgi:hypothetical protein
MALGVKEIYEKAGWQVIGMGFTGKAAEELQKGSGIFTDTITKFLAMKKDHIQTGKTLWLVDEASMVGSKDTVEITRLAAKYDAKISVIKDQKQFMAISAGRPVAIIQERGLAEVASMDDIQRQRNAPSYVRDIVALLAKAEGIINKAQVQALKIKYGETARPVKEITETFLKNVMEGKFNAINYSPLYRQLIKALVGKKEDQSLRKTDLPKAREILEKQLVKAVNIDKAMGILQKNGQLFEAPNRKDDLWESRKERLELVASKYLEKAAEGKGALIVTAMNKDRTDINATIREKLVEMGKVEQGHEFSVLDVAKLGGTMKQYADAYKLGQVVVIMKEDESKDNANSVKAIRSIDGKWHRIGIRGEVVERNAEKNTVTVEYKVKKEPVKAEFDVGKNGHCLTVYDKVNLNFGVGERVVFLKNDTKLGVTNGVTGTIKKLDQHGNCTTDIDGDGKSPEKTVKFNMGGYSGKGGISYDYLGHGYAVTEYKSQGQTVDYVIWHVEADQKFSSMTTTNSFYVVMTRERQEAIVITSDVEELKKMIKEEQYKVSTLDFYDPDRKWDKVAEMGHDPAAIKAAVEAQVKKGEHRMDPESENIKVGKDSPEERVEKGVEEYIKDLHAGSAKENEQAPTIEPEHAPSREKSVEESSEAIVRKEESLEKEMEQLPPGPGLGIE